MKTLLVLIVSLCASVLPGWAPAQEEDPAAPSQIEPHPSFVVLGLHDRPALRDSIHMKMLNSLATIAEHTDLIWPGTAEIVWADEQEFRNATGFRPEHVAAAASAAQGRIWINARSWLRSPPHEQQQTLTHEAGHLLVGSLPGGRELPLWTNEGIVMHLAGQWSWDEQMSLLSAHFVGRTPHLQRLQDEFPRDPAGQSLAYRTSYVAVQVLAEELGDEPEKVRRLLLELADEEKGPALALTLRDPLEVLHRQKATERELGSRLTIGVILLSGSGFLFLVISVMVIVAYFRVKAKNAERVREEEADEPWAQSLTDEDVQDIYGDREDRWDRD